MLGSALLSSQVRNGGIDASGKERTYGRVGQHDGRNGLSPHPIDSILWEAWFTSICLMCLLRPIGIPLPDGVSAAVLDELYRAFERDNADEACRRIGPTHVNSTRTFKANQRLPMNGCGLPSILEIRA